MKEARMLDRTVRQWATGIASAMGATPGFDAEAVDVRYDQINPPLEVTHSFQILIPSAEGATVLALVDRLERERASELACIPQRIDDDPFADLSWPVEVAAAV
jgi:hypothetical protein